MERIEGFYAAYLTAAGGHGIVMMIFRSGIVTGADVGGAKYDGTYELIGMQIKVALQVTLPPNTQLVYGGTVGAEEERYTIEHLLPADFASRDFVQINGQKGLINAKIVKLRDVYD